MRLVGTTKTTLQAIHNRTHWNSAALTPMDPVTLGLCSQMDLDFEVNRAAKERAPVEEDRKQTCVPAEITTAPRPEGLHDEDVFSHRPAVPQEEENRFASVFAKPKA